jgi:anti-sigma factor RsiW
MNETLERLLWQRTDGELTVEHRRELEVLLAQGVSAKEEERELESVARLLSRARFSEEEVPAELRQRVMVQVKARSTSSRRSRLVLVSNAKRRWIS